MRDQAKVELAGSTYCFGYLGGYIDGLNVLREQVCLHGASLNTIARVYVLYMQKNPTLMEEGRALGLLLALKSSSPITASPLDRTPEEFTRYVKRLEELGWRLVGDCEEYQALMEDESMEHRTYVEALELLILMKSGGAD